MYEVIVRDNYLIEAFRRASLEHRTFRLHIDGATQEVTVGDALAFDDGCIGLRVRLYPLKGK